MAEDSSARSRQGRRAFWRNERQAEKHLHVRQENAGNGHAAEDVQSWDALVDGQWRGEFRRVDQVRVSRMIDLHHGLFPENLALILEDLLLIFHNRLLVFQNLALVGDNRFLVCDDLFLILSCRLCHCCLLVDVSTTCEVPHPRERNLRQAGWSWGSTADGARVLPSTAPTPIRSVLRIGPTGLDKVFTATAHARRNPMAAPSTVGQYWDRTIQCRQRAIRAMSIEARSPPIIPPAQRPTLPNE